MNGREKHNLPLAATPFAGREKEPPLLGQLIADPHARIITISGPGGYRQDAPGPGSGRRTSRRFNEDY